LRDGGTTVYEPLHRFDLEIPADTFGAMMPVLSRLRAIPQVPMLRGAAYFIDGEIPAEQVHKLQQLLPGLTRGEGVLESAFASYQPVSGGIPTRTRTDHNPLNRKEYLQQVQSRSYHAL
jgi:ribosomal protection tetracycline resistance protein